MAMAKCSYCGNEQDKDTIDWPFYDGFSEMFLICDKCEPDYDFWSRMVESMQKNMDYMTSHSRKLVHKNADLITELKTIQDTVNQAIKGIRK